MGGIIRSLFINAYLFIIASNIATIAGITAATTFWPFIIGSLLAYNVINQFVELDAIFKPISLIRLPFYLLTAYLITFLTPALGLSAGVGNLIKVLAPYVFEFTHSVATYTIFAVRNLFQQNPAANPENDFQQALILNNNERAQQAINAINDPQVLLNMGLTALHRGLDEVFTAVVNRLHAINPQHVAMNDNVLLRAAAHHQRVEAVTTLLRKQAVRNVANARNNEALREVCINGNVRIAQALLEQRAVNANLTFNNNEALRLAEREDRLTLVELLLGKQTVANFNPPAHAQLTFTHIDFAPFYPHGVPVPAHRPGAAPMAPAPAEPEHPFAQGANIPLIDMLFGGLRDQNGPAFRRRDEEEDLHVEEAQDRDLRGLAADEGAMRGNNERQRTALNEMEQRYRAEFQRKTRDGIFNEVREFLIARYNANPAMFGGQRLPLDRGWFNIIADNTPYYRHPTHTAYRYLCLSPNPWMSPIAGYTRAVPGGHAAALGEQDKDKIAYMWLAATDHNQVLPEGYTREALLEEFVQSIAELGRAHNYDRTRRVQKMVRRDGVDRMEWVDEHYDDMEGDKPTCGVGVNQRITQFYMVFLNDRPETRPITPDVISQKFRQEMMNESPLAGSLYNKLRRLDRDTLNQLEQALDDLVVINMGDRDEITEEQRQLLDRFAFTNAEITAFIDSCKAYYGANRITQRRNGDQRVAFLHHRFESYEAMIRHLARDALGQYYDDVKRNIGLLKNAPRPQDDADDDVPAPRGQRRGQTTNFDRRRRRAAPVEDDDAEQAPRPRRRGVTAH